MTTRSTVCPVRARAPYTSDGLYSGNRRLQLSPKLIQIAGSNMTGGYSKVLDTFCKLETTSVFEHPLFTDRVVTTVLDKMRSTIGITANANAEVYPMDLSTESRRLLRTANELLVELASLLACQNMQEWKTTVIVSSYNGEYYHLPAEKLSEELRTDDVRTLFTLLWATEMFATPLHPSN